MWSVSNSMCSVHPLGCLLCGRSLWGFRRTWENDQVKRCARFSLSSGGDEGEREEEGEDDNNEEEEEDKDNKDKEEDMTSSLSTPTSSSPALAGWPTFF